MTSASAKDQTGCIKTGCRVAAVLLFVVWPAVQVFVPRATPFFFGLSVTLLLLAVAIDSLTNKQSVSPLATFAPLPSWHITLPFLAFCVWIAISLSWSPLALRGLKDVLVLLVGFLCAGFLIRCLAQLEAELLGRLFIASLIIGSTGLILESWEITSFHDTFLETNGIFDLNRNAAWLLVVACVAQPLWRREAISFWTAALVGLLVVAAIFSSQNETAKLALVVVVIASMVTWYLPQLIKPAFTMAALAILTMPLIAGTLTDGTGRPLIPLPLEAHAEHRIALWQGYSELIAREPVTGWGAKASRALGENGQATEVAAQRGYPDRTTSPHNAAIEIWVDLGLIGAALAATIVMVAGWRVSTTPPAVRVSGVATITAVYTISMTGSAFYQAWWITTIATGFVVWGCAAANVGGERRPDESDKTAG